MRPPNLKIWAERVHEIKQGKQVAGEKESTNLIGNEGITLEDDLAVSIHTEWLDHNGLPLPAELGDFGYTARIAKVSSTPTPDVDALQQNSSNEFAIKPGRNLNVLQFNQKELSRHHFYVQVNPYPKSEQNDFGSDIYNPLHKNYLPDGSGTDEHDLPSVENTDLKGTQTTQANPLRYRPAHYVPFKVPLYDEGYSQIQQDVYDDLKEQHADNPAELEKLEKPDPLYRWYYRPELQFSQYNFDAKSLIVNQVDDEGTESTTEIEIEEDGADFGPIFDDYTDSVELLFDLLGPELDRLPALENDREFVLSLGGEEAIATIGADGKVTFNNPDHLTQLTEEDLLSLRLYLNGDAGNILWEYTFGLPVNVYPETAFISADNPYIDFVASQIVDFEEYPDAVVKIQWTPSSGQMQHSITNSGIGIYTNRLETTRYAGSTYTVIAKVVFSNVPTIQVGTEKEFGPYEVIPGKPANIALNPATQTPLLSDGKTQTTISGLVKDAHGNTVEDGTPVSWDSGYSGILTNEVIETSGGLVSVNYQTGVETLDTDITLQSGEATDSVTITKSPFDFAMSLSTYEVEVGDQSGITVTINTSTASSEAINIIWNTTYGSIQGEYTLTGSTATATYFPDEIAGDAQITAVIGGVQRSAPLRVKQVGDDAVVFGVPALVNAQPGEMAVVDTLDGGTAQHRAVTDTTATVYGTPGTDVTLKVGGFFTPNAVSSFHLNTNEVRQRDGGEQYVLERISGAEGVFSSSADISVNYAESWNVSGSSLEFKQGNITVSDVPALDITDRFFSNIRFNTKIAQEQTLFEKGSGSYKLGLVNEDGFKVKATVQTNNGSYSVLSDVINPNEWIIAGLRLRNGKLELRVNNNEFSTAAPGAIVHGGFSNDLVIGQSFQGYMGDLKIGAERSAATLISLGNDSTEQTLPIGDDGKAVFTVKSNGVQVTSALMQRVGFTLTRSDQQTADNQPVVQDVRIAQQVFNRLTGLSFIQYANARPIGSNAGHHNEDGIGLADKELYGWFTEAALKGLFGDAYEPIKTSLTFLYEMSGISDIGVIITIIGDLLAGKKFQTEQAIDLGFATIGLTLTIVTVATGGAGGGLKVALKKPLDTLKALLKELFINPADVLKLVKGGGTIVKRTFVLMKGFVTGDPKAAKELADIVTGMTKSASDASGKTLKFMMAMAQSPKRFARFLKLIRTSEKAAAAGSCAVSTAQLIRGRLLPLSITPAYASDGACDLMGSLVTSSARYGDEANRIASSMAGIVNKLGDANIFLNNSSLTMLAKLEDRAHGEAFNKFVDNMIEGAAGMGNLKADSNGFGRVLDSGETVLDRFLAGLNKMPENADGYDDFMVRIHDKNQHWLRGMFGEAESVESIKQLFPNIKLDSLKVNDKVEWNDKRNQFGIDIEAELETGQKLFVESKVAGSGRTLDDFTKQFDKHLKTKIEKLVENTANGPKFIENKTPLLHYEFRGGFDDIIATRTKFLEICNGKRFKKIRRAGFSCETSLSFAHNPDLIQPLIN